MKLMIFISPRLRAPTVGAEGKGFEVGIFEKLIAGFLDSAVGSIDTLSPLYLIKTPLGTGHNSSKQSSGRYVVQKIFGSPYFDVGQNSKVFVV
jgi:hypothetical protein